MSSIAAVLNKVQRSMAAHRKGMASLARLHKSQSAEYPFALELLKTARPIFLVKQKDPAVERVIHFLAQYAATTDLPAVMYNADGDELHQDFLLFFMNFCVNTSRAREEAPRYRACQLLAKLMSSLSDEEELEYDAIHEQQQSDAFLDAFQEQMLARLKDKYPKTRAMAALALSRLQDVEDDECVVVRALKWLLAHDSSKYVAHRAPRAQLTAYRVVRLQVLDCIAITRRTIGPIIQRSRDVNPDVRRGFFKVIGAKVDVRSLRIAHRAAIAVSGLTDRVPAVKTACASMICDAWLKSAESELALMELFDVEENEQAGDLVAKALVEHLFNSRRVRSANDVEIVLGQVEEILEEEENMGTGSEEEDEVNERAAFVAGRAQFWRVATNAAVDAQLHDVVEALVPEAPVLCRLIRAHLHNEFILRQYLGITRLGDWSDEGGRRMMAALCCESLLAPSTAPGAVPDLVKTLIHVHPSAADAEEVARLLHEVVRSICAPLERMETEEAQQQLQEAAEQLEEIREKMQELSHKKARCVKKEDFEQARVLKAELRALRDEALPLEKQCNFHDELEEYVLVRCLIILESFFDPSEMYTSGEAARALLKVTVELERDLVDSKAMDHFSPEVRCAAIRFKTIVALSDAFSKHGAANKPAEVVSLLCGCLDVEDDVEVQLTLVKSLFDLLLRFGMEECVRKSDDEREEGEGEDERPATHVLDALIPFLGNTDGELRTVAVEGFAKLLFMDVLADNPEVVARLILLFCNPTTEEDLVLRQCLAVFFPAYRLSWPHVVMLERCFVPTIQTLLDAPIHSPLHTVNAVEVGKMLLCLTQPPEACDYEPEYSVHDRLALEVANEAISAPEEELKIWLKILCEMDVSCEVAKDLKVLAGQIRAGVTDAVSKKALTMFEKRLQPLVEQKIHQEEAARFAQSIEEEEEEEEIEEAASLSEDVGAADDDDDDDEGEAGEEEEEEEEDDSVLEGSDAPGCEEEDSDE